MAWDPIVRTSVSICSLLVVATTGCRTSQQTAIPNPFLSADRVPAPGSRIPAVGTAQPYYPGDPVPQLPAGQPAMPQPGMVPLGALPPSDDITPIQGEDAFAAASRAPTGQLLSDRDGGIQIPTDEGTMRFAGVTPRVLPEATGPVAMSEAAPLQPVAIAAAPAAPTPTVFRDGQRPAVTTPAINNWPPSASSAPQVMMTPAVDTEPAAGLFRDPRVPAEAPALIDERSVSPRIRMPGGAELIREEVVPGSINTTSYQVGMAGGGTSTLVIPPPGYVPESFAPATATSNFPPADGFRPRGSSRGNFGSNGHNDAAVATLRVTPG